MAGVVFFLVFYLVMALIFLNLFVAVILEGYETMNQSMRTLLPEEELNNFVICWSQFDFTVSL